MCLISLIMEQTVTGQTSNSSVIVQGVVNQEEGQIALGTISDSSRLSQGPGVSPGLSPQGKLFGRNFNGTMVVTSTPTNEAELQLYRVLQRASLLAYYDTLLEMGGDDVQQLCDAGEEEFLEIMALVGMSSKPLHVRRLQKSLQEWVNNPSSFQSPLPNVDIPRMAYSPEPANTSRSPFGSTSSYGSTQPITSSTTNTVSFSTLGTTLSNPILPTPVQLTPTLTDIQINRLTSAAERLSRQLPQLEPKPQNSKKRSSRELEQVMTMNETDPRRMDEIRKYAAIYGRFDCKRRPEKPLTLHEVCVNEAAAQICKYVPALLTRRDELFPLARQVVRDSGFGHSAGIARFSLNQQHNRSEDNENNLAKRSRLSSDTSSDHGKDIEESRTSLLSIYQRVGKSFDIAEAAKFAYFKPDFEDADSRFSFSSSGSPPTLQNASNGMDTENLDITNNGKEEIKEQRNTQKSPDLLDNHGVHIISSSGGHIIAVANPALALSSALSDSLTTMKREVISPNIR